MTTTCQALNTLVYAGFPRARTRRRSPKGMLRAAPSASRAFTRADAGGEDARTVAGIASRSPCCTYVIVGRLDGPMEPAENPLSAVWSVLLRETNMAVRQPLELQRLHLAVTVLYHKINTPRCYQHRQRFVRHESASQPAARHARTFALLYRRTPPRVGQEAPDQATIARAARIVRSPCQLGRFAGAGYARKSRQYGLITIAGCVFCDFCTLLHESVGDEGEVGGACGRAARVCDSFRARR